MQKPTPHYGLSRVLTRQTLNELIFYSMNYQVGAFSTTVLQKKIMFNHEITKRRASLENLMNFQRHRAAKKIKTREIKIIKMDWVEEFTTN